MKHKKFLEIAKGAFEGMSDVHGDASKEHDALSKVHDKAKNDELATGHANLSSLHKIASDHCAVMGKACEKMMATADESDGETRHSTGKDPEIPSVAEMTDTNSTSFGSRSFASASRVADLEGKIADLQERFGLNKLRPIDGVSAVAPSDASARKTSRLVARPGEEAIDKTAETETMAKAFPGLGA